MSAIIIRSPGVIQNPDPDAPKLPDISTGLLFRFDAADLELEDGADVTSWISPVGGAPLTNRTLDKIYPGSAWAFPKLDADAGPDGGPAVTFNGSQCICGPDSPTVYNQPVTIALLCKANGFVGGAQNLALSMGTNIVIRPSSTGYNAGNGSNSSEQIQSGYTGTDWVSVIFVANGASSKLKIGDGPILTGNGGLNATTRLVLGGTYGAKSSDGFSGRIRVATGYSRALTDDDINGLAYDLMALVP